MAFRFFRLFSDRMVCMYTFVYSQRPPLSSSPAVKASKRDQCQRLNEAKMIEGDITLRRTPAHKANYDDDAKNATLQLISEQEFGWNRQSAYSFKTKMRFTNRTENPGSSGWWRNLGLCSGRSVDFTAARAGDWSVSDNSLSCWDFAKQYNTGSRPFVGPATEPSIHDQPHTHIHQTTEGLATDKSGEPGVLGQKQNKNVFFLSTVPKEWCDMLLCIHSFYKCIFIRCHVSHEFASQFREAREGCEGVPGLDSVSRSIWGFSSLGFVFALG